MKYIELNGSNIDESRNAIKCGTCSAVWGLEHFITDVYFCDNCGHAMCKTRSQPMPIRDALMRIKRNYGE